MDKALFLNNLRKSLENFAVIDVMIVKYQSDKILIPGLTQSPQPAGRVQKRFVHRRWIRMKRSFVVL